MQDHLERLEDAAEQRMVGDRFRCGGCNQLIKPGEEMADENDASPYAAPICPKCAGSPPEGEGLEDSTDRLMDALSDRELGPKVAILIERPEGEGCG